MEYGNYCTTNVVYVVWSIKKVDLFLIIVVGRVQALLLYCTLLYLLYINENKEKDGCSVYRTVQ
jgi:hypothetical protein